MSNNPTAVLDALSHTGQDKSRISESAEYVLKLVLPAINDLQEKKASVEEVRSLLSDFQVRIEETVTPEELKSVASSLLLKLDEMAEVALQPINGLAQKLDALTDAIRLIATKLDAEGSVDTDYLSQVNTALS